MQLVQEISFTFAATDKGDQLVFATANDGTNPDIDTTIGWRCNSYRNTNFNKQNFN